MLKIGFKTYMKNIHGICVQCNCALCTLPVPPGRASIFAGILVDANALKSHNAWRTVRTTTPDCPLSAHRWKISSKNCSAKTLVNATEGKKRAHTHTFFSFTRHPQVRAMPFREGGACMEFAWEIKCKVQNVDTQIPIIKHTCVGNNTLGVWPSCSQQKVTTKKWWQCMNNIKTHFPVLGCNPSQREKRKVQTGHWLRHYILCPNWLRHYNVCGNVCVQIQVEMYQTIGKPPVRRVS